MKKNSSYLLLSALSLGLVATSCQDEDFGVSEEQVHESAVARQFVEVFGTPSEEQDFDLYGQMKKAGLTRATVSPDGTVTERAYLFAEDLWSGAEMDFDYNDVVYAVSVKYNIAQDFYKFYVDPVCVASGRNQWLMLNKNYNWPTIGYCPQKGKTDVMVECHSIMEPYHQNFTYYAKENYPSDYAAHRKQTILAYYQEKLSSDDLADLSDMIDKGGAAAAFVNMELPDSGCEIDLKDCFGTQSTASNAGYYYTNMPTIDDVKAHAADGTLLSWLYYGAVYRGNEGFFEIRSSADSKPVNVNYQAYNYYALTSETTANNYNGNTDLTNVQHYLGNGKVPRLIMVPTYYTYNGEDCVFEWPKETVCLKDAYPNIVNWVTYKNSDGTVRENWIADNASVFSGKVRDNVTKQPSRYVDLLKFNGPVPETAKIANNSTNYFRDQLVALIGENTVTGIQFVTKSSVTSSNTLATAEGSEATVYLSINEQGMITVSTAAKKFLVESCSELFNSMFEGSYTKLSGVTTISGLGNIDTQSETSFFEMFQGCKNLTTIEGLDKLNTSSVTNMMEMFVNCESLKSVDLSGWTNASGNIDVKYMFSGTEKMEKIDFGTSFDLSRISGYPSGMFYSCGYSCESHLLEISCSEATATWLKDNNYRLGNNGTKLGVGTASQPYIYTTIKINGEVFVEAKQ